MLFRAKCNSLTEAEFVWCFYSLSFLETFKIIQIMVTLEDKQCALFLTRALCVLNIQISNFSGSKGVQADNQLNF